MSAWFPYFASHSLQVRWFAGLAMSPLGLPEYLDVLCNCFTSVKKKIILLGLAMIVHCWVAATNSAIRLKTGPRQVVRGAVPHPGPEPGTAAGRSGGGSRSHKLSLLSLVL